MKTILTLILFVTVTAHAEVTQSDVNALAWAVEQANKQRSTKADLEAVFLHDKQSIRAMKALEAVKAQLK